MKLEQIQFIISRYDHYYDGVNSKGQFFLGLNTFIIGGLGAAFLTLNNIEDCVITVYILLGGLLIFSFLSIGFTLSAILPYLKSNEGKSLVFFGSVSRLPNEVYITEINNCGKEKILNDLACQAHYLAIGLTQKYKQLKYAGIAILVQFILLIPFLIFFFQLLNTN